MNYLGKGYALSSKLASERSLSDAELVHAACRGDKRAFVEIVARQQAPHRPQQLRAHPS